MIFFPAIDLKDGQCVRLVKGIMEKTTVFNNSQTEQARLFQQGYAKVKQSDVWGYTDASGLFVEHLDAGAFVDKTGEFISERDYKNWGKPPHSRE